MSANPEPEQHVARRRSRLTKLWVGKAFFGAFALAIAVGGGAMLAGFDVGQRTLREPASERVKQSSQRVSPEPSGEIAPADVEVLLEHLRIELPRHIERAKANCRRGTIYAWPWSYLARATLEAYDRTRDQRFLDVFVETADVVVDDRDHLHGRLDEYRRKELPTWGTCRHPKGKYASVIAHAGRIAQPLLWFSLIASEDEAMPEKYRARVQPYTSAAKRALAVFDGDYRRILGEGLGYYNRPLRGDVEPLNHVHAEAFVLLYALTGDASYRKRVKELGAYFLAATWEDANGCRQWPYQALPETLGTRAAKADATWKAQITMLFPIAAYEQGLVFDPSFIEGFSCLFRHNVHQGDLVFARRISGGKAIDGTSSRHQLLAGWYVLKKYDSRVGEVIEAAIDRRPDLFSGGWFTHPATVLAYAQRLEFVQ